MVYNVAGWLWARYNFHFISCVFFSPFCVIPADSRARAINEPLFSLHKKFVGFQYDAFLSHKKWCVLIMSSLIKYIRLHTAFYGIFVDKCRFPCDRTHRRLLYTFPGTMIYGCACVKVTSN